MNEQPRSLRDLVVAAGDRHPGDSDRALGRRATDAGYPLVGTTISGIRNATYRSRPSHKTLDALAWLAGVSRETAYAAAGERFAHTRFADELPPDADQLSPKQRQAVVTVIRAMLDPGLQAAGSDQVPGTTSPAEPVEHQVDEVEQARRQARINRGPEPPAEPAAARSDSSRDIDEHTASLHRGEDSQDDGGEDPA